MTFQILMFAVAINGGGIAVGATGNYSSFAICEAARIDAESRLNAPVNPASINFSYRLTCMRRT